MIKRIYVVASLLANAIAFTSLNATAADSPSQLPYPDGFFKDAFERNAIRATHLDNQQLIPENAYYKSIFREIMINPKYRDIPREDWLIISELPSHSDDRFVSQTFADMRKMCEALNENEDIEVVAAM